MSKNRILVIIILSILSCACAPVQIKEELKPVTLDEAGYLVGTIGHKRWGPFGSHSFIFQGILFTQKDSQESVEGTIGFLSGGFGDNPIDYKDASHLGAAFSIPLKPGVYEIRGLRFISDDPLGSKNRVPDCSMAIPFTITKGKRTYIGDFSASTISENRKVYDKFDAPGFFWFKNNLDADLPLLNKKFPAQSSLDVSNDSPSKDYPPCLISTATKIE